MTIKILAIIIYGGWACLSIIFQFNKYREAKFKEYDIFSLIPYWTFFAPNPSISDYRLFYILSKDDGTKSNFMEVNFFLTKRFLSVVWNPYKRINKFFFDVIQSLVQLFKEIDVDRISKTLPYYILLNYLREANKGNKDYTEIQFVIVESYGIITTKDPKLIFSSKVHKLP